MPHLFRNKIVLAVLPFALTVLLPLTGFAQTKPAAKEPAGKPEAATPVVAAVNPKALIKTSLGDITVELNAEKAPKSVENFLQYAKEGFYNGTIFHRVINNFMIQGGGFTPDLHQKPTKPSIQNEAKNGLSNLRGTVAMARTSDPNSGAAQFFINVVDNDFLDFKSPSGQGWGYCVFGEVVEGMDVVDKIRAVATGNKGFHQDVPKEDVIIEKAEIV